MENSALLEPSFWVVAGLGVLAIGGELVVRGSVKVARALRLSEIVIGVALLGFGTSLPEMVASIQGVLLDAPGIALGNVVGSNIANLLLIAGAAAALGSVKLDKTLVARDGLTMTAATLLLAALLWFNMFSTAIGAGLVALLAVYLIWAIRSEAEAGAEEHGAPPPDARPMVAALGGLAIFAAGLACVIFGGRLLVQGGIDIAQQLGVSDTLIGVTIVAVGTSAPELATTISAAIKGRASLAIGNVFGSNIFNSLGIVGVTAMFGDLVTPPELLEVDLWAMLLATAVMMLFATTRARLSRAEGFILLAAYIGYVSWTASVAI